MSTKALYDKLFETFEDETSGNNKILLSEDYQAIQNVHSKSYLACCYGESRNELNTNQIEGYKDLFNQLNTKFPIPLTLEVFDLFYKDFYKPDPNTYQIPDELVCRLKENEEA